MGIGASAIKAGAAYVELAIRDGLFNKGLRAAEGRLVSNLS